jgi:hypothetical protein
MRRGVAPAHSWSRRWSRKPPPAGAHRVQGGVFEADAVGRSLFESLGYRPVRTFREMRIALDSAPPPPSWPAGLRAQSFDPERDAHDFHAAHQEAFADR